ncbi:sortase domain-containing protein [Geodermatophilus chilensis]|uniref:sortase domain-containing protein n=1 Tax=Geodermatophilus chilensis TaxID=2035835 RepID=UPI000C26AF69|nr:sortase [Geodermatophilus chilensis]
MTDSGHAPSTGEELRPVRAGHGGRHRRGRRELPGWVSPSAAALALGLLVGVTVADRSADASAGRAALPPVVAEEPAAGDDQPVAPSLPQAPTQQPVPQTATALAHVEPVRLDIPSIDVSSPLVGLGLNGDKTLEVPVDFSKPGWFTKGSYPGDPQGPPAIIAGHVDDYTGPAVFARLGELQEGDDITVVRADSSVAVFRVTAAQRFAKDEFPAEQVYGAVPASEVVLITCTGGFDEQARSYTENLVVRARLDADRSRELSANRAAVGVGAPDSDLPNV